MNVLRVDSSALGAQSVTRRLTAALAERQRAGFPGAAVVERDLDATPLPHAVSTTLANADEAARSSEVLEEFLAADTVVIGVPMYNFGIPSTLKAWIDRLMVAGRTFRYGATGPEGLVRGKTVILAIAAGGDHAGQPTDFVEPYLRQVFAFIGVTDIRVVRADGVSLSPGHRERAIEEALRGPADPVARAA